VRDGISAPDVTLGLTPGARPEPRRSVEPKESEKVIAERIADFYAYRRWISRSTPALRREASV
jgi:hypothetical protein